MTPLEKAQGHLAEAIGLVELALSKTTDDHRVISLLMAAKSHMQVAAAFERDAQKAYLLS